MNNYSLSVWKRKKKNKDKTDDLDERWVDCWEKKNCLVEIVDGQELKKR